MKKNIKCLLSLIVLVGFFAIPAFSQQVTRFGVVDTAKVYNAYFRDSAPVRNYERKKDEFQAEIDKLTEELRQLQEKRLHYIDEGKDTKVLEVETDIAKKKQYLTEYTNAKNVELEVMQKSLMNSDDFYKKLYNTLKNIAESGGYSMILSLQAANAILWYSPSVDITDQVIKDLGL